MSSRTTIHPGQHLAARVKVLGMRASELGRQLKLPANKITGILNSRRSITGDSALRLAEAKAGAEVRRLPRLREGEKSEQRRDQARKA